VSSYAKVVCRRRLMALGILFFLSMAVAMFIPVVENGWLQYVPLQILLRSQTCG
jgi:hypothetical protein